jgi:uncharacterized cupredoxin-like copper-binding protein
MTDTLDTPPATPPSPSPPDDALSQPLLLGSGQAAWLAVVTVVSVLALSVSVIALLASSNDGGGSAAPPATGPSTTITAVATEFAFAPDSWTVPAGQEVTITLDNQGAIDHEWAIIVEGVTVASEAEFDEDLVLYEVEAIPGGSSETGTFTIENPGTYQVVCALPGHLDAGMVGTLVVQ